MFQDREGILLDRKDVGNAPYFSNGMDYGVPAAVLGSGYLLEEQWVEGE